MAPFVAHPVQRRAGIETAGKCDADLLADGKVLQDVRHERGVLASGLRIGYSSLIVLAETDPMPELSPDVTGWPSRRSAARIRGRKSSSGCASSIRFCSAHGRACRSARPSGRQA